MFQAACDLKRNLGAGQDASELVGCFADQVDPGAALSDQWLEWREVLALAATAGDQVDAAAVGT